MLAINLHPFPELATPRLRIRQLNAGDAGNIFKLRSDKKVNRFLGREECKSMDEAAAFINKINRGISNNECVYWAIDLNETANMVGTICLWNIQLENYRGEIGYELLPEYWGKGIMGEAITRIIDYAFSTMNLHTLEAETDPANTQSVLLLERSGFVKEGHFKDSFFKNGKFCDRAVYSIIKSSR